MTRPWLLNCFWGLFAGMVLAGTDFPVPPRLALAVSEAAGAARVNEVVRSGVPIPRELGLTSTAGLRVRDGEGAFVPAAFAVLARWDAGLTDETRPIQWLLVSFPATVAAGGRRAYELVFPPAAGPAPAMAPALSVERSGDVLTVRTGAAVFVLGGQTGALFDEIRLPDGILVAEGGATSVCLQQPTPMETTCCGLPTVTLASVDDLSAVVKIETPFDWPGAGGGRLQSVRRYVFRAGSPVALVRQSLAWQGDLCPPYGLLACDWDGDGTAERNGVLLDRLEAVLTPKLEGTRTVRLWGARAEAPTDSVLAAGETAALRQRLRSRRLDPLRFELDLPRQPLRTGSAADAGMLVLSGDQAALAVALNRMPRYEPQALRIDADGRLAVDFADDRVWLGSHQGLFAEAAVGVFASLPSPAELEQTLWAPLTYPLRAWPSPAWFNASGAVEEFPAGALPPAVASWRQHVPDVLARTVRLMEEKGLPGLMTFGVYPRYWGYPGYDELDCGEGAEDAWDSRYWCATWTDYHQTVSLPAVWSMAGGEPAWLDDLAFPGALRVLHTQVNQCAPEDPWFYCGQCPAGYGGYRFDFNGSHAYFENLFLYYWLTGDETVVETLARGAVAMRNYLCSKRPVQACGPEDPPTDDWAALSGRVSAQWLNTFRFVGLAGRDASFLDDWRSGLARLVTQHYVEGAWQGRTCGFLTSDRLQGPGAYLTCQLWLGSFYDWNNLDRFRRDTGDTPLGLPALRPSRMAAAWARTLAALGPNTAPGADGTVSGSWPNVMQFQWSGDRTQAVLNDVGYGEIPGSDPLLWATGKASLAAAVMRSARATGEPLLLDWGRKLAEYGLNASVQSQLPLGKEAGLFLTRLHPALAHYAALAYPDGDLNADGAVNAADLVVLKLVLSGAVEYGLPPAANTAAGDGNRNGRIDEGDLAVLAQRLSGG